jgi:hypothetical protein
MGKFTSGPYVLPLKYSPVGKDRLCCPSVLADKTPEVAKPVTSGVEPKGPLGEHEIDPNARGAMR